MLHSSSKFVCHCSSSSITDHLSIQHHLHNPDNDSRGLLTCFSDTIESFFESGLQLQGSDVTTLMTWLLKNFKVFLYFKEIFCFIIFKGATAFPRLTHPRLDITQVHKIDIWNIDSKKYPEISYLNILEYCFQILIEEKNCPTYQTPCIPEQNIPHI